MQSQTAWYKPWAGPKFTKLLHEVFSTLCVHETHPTAWQMSFMQPIYKGGDKSQAGPAWYLSSVLAQLFEGIPIFRLTKFTETHSTLTENQFGTRSSLQIHDAIYCLLSIIQYNISQKGLAIYVAFRGKILSLLSVRSRVKNVETSQGKIFTSSRSASFTLKSKIIFERIDPQSRVLNHYLQ